MTDSFLPILISIFVTGFILGFSMHFILFDANISKDNQNYFTNEIIKVTDKLKIGDWYYIYTDKGESLCIGSGTKVFMYNQFDIGESYNISISKKEPLLSIRGRSVQKINQKVGLP